MLSDDELRILGLAAPQLLRLLEVREERILKRIYADWRAQRYDQQMSLAEWVCIRDQILEIKRVLNQHYNEETKRHDTSADS